MSELIYQQIVASVAQALSEILGAPLSVPVIVERSRRPEHGDYSTSVCLRLAREARMAPVDLAHRVVERLPEIPFVGRVEVAHPGYINFWLDERWLASQVDVILEAGESFGNLSLGRGQRVQVEFVSANPTGPITIGSARNAVLGDVLASVLAAAGYQVEREYYVNDAGAQVRRFGESVFVRYAQALGEDLPFPDDGYHGRYVVELGERLAAEAGRRY
ncbi:MAG: arginine--tRNA ligase, partial [Thermoflexia bacterium]